MARLNTTTGTFTKTKTPTTKEDAHAVHEAYLRPAVAKKVKARRGQA